MLLIRPENDDDLPSILSVVEEAFHRPQEANLVDSLHRDEAVRVSLVALIDDKIVGHILFSPVKWEWCFITRLSTQSKMASEKCLPMLLDQFNSPESEIHS